MKRTMFNVAVFLAGAWAAMSFSPANAAGGVNGNLRGTVVDEQSGSPISGAAITASSHSGTFHAATDPRGFFALLQIPTDTYQVSIEKSGYIRQTLSGVTVLGDQSQSVGVIKIGHLITIGRVTSRSQSSAFQPNQTVDETTFVGQRVDQALGERGSTNFNQLVLSAPGVVQTTGNCTTPPAGGNCLNAFSIRGSASVEIGYQFDGVDYRGSFFDENPNQSFLNGVGGGRGGLQVVSGPGDATQGGIGAGVVNILPGRGSYPGDGFVSFDVAAPWYDHAFAFQYGTASKNGRFSEFFSSRSQRSAPQVAPYGRDAADAGSYRSTSFTYDDDVLNNFYYRFGKNNDQQLQLLVDWLDHRSWAQYGGLANAKYYPFDPFSYQQLQSDFATPGNPLWACLQPQLCVPDALGNPAPASQVAAQQLAFYQAIIPYLPGVPHIDRPLRQPEQYVYGPTNFLKLGYTRNLGSKTTLNAFFYNWGGLVANNITGTSSDLTTGSFLPGFNNAGGRRVGFQAQVTRQASEKHTLSLVAKYENGFPYWLQQNHGNTFQGFIGGRTVDAGNFTVGQPLPNNGAVSGARIEDWYLPLTPGQPISAANPCVGPAIDNAFDPTKPTSTGCYLYSWLLAHGKWNGHLPAVPATGFDYNHTDFQQFGIGFRDQWTPNARLHVDYGLRLDGQNLRWGANPFNKDLGNTADVGVGFATLPSTYLKPRILQPRASIDYVLTPNDSVRFSYGRSASFFFGQTAGTPTNMTIVDPVLFGIPAKDSAAINLDPAKGPVTFGPACGSGWHGKGSNANGTYVQSPYNFFSGSGTLGQAGWYFKCPNYASSVYWAFDQAFSAPDIGGQRPATYNNWDFAYAHQFKNGWGAKLVSYARRGYNTYQVTMLGSGPPDPVTGQQSAGSFQERQTGIQKAFGLEFMLTTPNRPFGWSGFLTANYINELTNTPPVSGSDSLPPVAQYVNESGTIWHQAFLPPLSARAGVQYKTRTGLRINPIVSFDGGEPFGVGKDALGFVNGVLYHLPTGNLGIAIPYAGPVGPNQSSNATCYVDPAYGGTYFKPRDFACRGYDEPALAGQKYTRPRLFTDLNVEYERGRATFGVYVSNVFDNYRGQPGVNRAWQPVATGLGGLQTGQFANAFPVLLDGTPNPLYANGARDSSRFDETWLPFSRAYQAGRTYRFYLQIKL